jgi:phage-related protein
VARKIEVQIVGDADSLHRALGKAQDSTGRFGRVLGGGFRVAALGAGAAVIGLGYALKRGVDDFNESQQVAAQLRAVLKSTGGQAGVTAKHVNNLAQSLSNMSGVDDEAIGASENLLLTFRNVRNEVGKGNDIFDQATKATLDLSVAMGTDLHSASILVGKALNDPVKGMTALRRVGVSLSSSQEDLIKHLVDTGHAAEAQKIILGELTKEFGGSAKAAGETMAGQMNKLKNAFDNAASSIIQQLLPYAVRLAQVAFPLVVGAVQNVANGIRGAIRWVADMASHFQVLGGKSESAGNRIHNAWQMVVGFFRGNVMPIIRQLRNIFQDSMQAIARVVQQHGDEIHRIMDRVGRAMRAIAEVVMPILRSALVKTLPRAIGAGITALDLISSAIETLINWINEAIHGIEDLGNKINSLPGLPFDVNQGLLGQVGIDVNQGLLNQGGNKAVVSGGASARPMQINLHLDGKQVESILVNRDKVYRRQNGRGLFA